MNHYWVILFLLLFALAWPVLLTEKSWWRLLAAMAMSFLVVVLPLFVFFFSAFMVPEWKGACRFEWVDCFIVGKLALTPLVLVATAALYRLEVLRDKDLTDRWPVMGIYLGAIVATVCLIFGLACLRWQMWLLVPLYVAAWYAARSLQLMIKSPVGFWPYFLSTLGTIPFWLASWEWSKSVYESLPNQAPQGCFVVTAASRGHPNLVGPFSEIKHGERNVFANRQLITFWQFESRWHETSPRSHQMFRRGYNRLGPLVAARIRSPWLADAAFLALKPAEWLARFCLRGNASKEPHHPQHI